jgi:hypothetical protein
MKRRSSTSEERSNLTEHICLLGRWWVTNTSRWRIRTPLLKLIVEPQVTLRLVVIFLLQSLISYIDMNQKDYRAWYGLAQAYELLSMHQYALYYFQKATTLRYVPELPFSFT